MIDEGFVHCSELDQLVGSANNYFCGESELLVLCIDETKLESEIRYEDTYPKKAAEDAIHIAVAVVNGVDYLISWNCKHISNAMMREKIKQICRTSGYKPSIICTPEELLEDE